MSSVDDSWRKSNTVIFIEKVKCEEESQLMLIVLWCDVSNCVFNSFFFFDKRVCWHLCSSAADQLVFPQKDNLDIPYPPFLKGIYSFCCRSFSCSYRFACWCLHVPLSMCALFPSLSHPRPTSFLSTCKEEHANPLEQHLTVSTHPSTSHTILSPPWSSSPPLLPRSLCSGRPLP